MIFANLHLWTYLLVGLLALAIGAFFRRKSKGALNQWIHESQWTNVIPEFSSKRADIRFWSLFVAWVLMAIALLRPQWGEKEQVIQRQGMDILVLMDISNSMAAEDTPPSRLNIAQNFVKRLLTRLPQDRVGVIGFAESAYVAAPLTTDFGYITEIADTLSPQMIQNQGTNVANAIESAIKAFERGGEDVQKNSRGVILITDGEDFGNGAESAAEALRKFGSAFLVLSVGGTEGAPIPIRNEAGILQTYKKDRKGQTVLTRVNRNLAQKLAEAGGGKQLDLVNPEDSAYAASKLMSQWSRGSLQDQKTVMRVDRFQIFLALALGFFIAHLLAGYRRPKWRLSASTKRQFSSSATVALACFILLQTTDTQAQGIDPYLKNRSGLKKFSSGDFEGALQDFEASQKNDPSNPKIDFNRGTAAANAKKSEDASIHFKNSTQKALDQGDYETAIQSLYNDGIMNKDAKNFETAFDRLTKAVELAKMTQDSELEKKARQALKTAVQEQQQEDQKKQNQKDNQKDPNQQGNEEKEDSQQDQDQPPQNPEKPDNKKRQFKSGTLSKDVAEGIMSDLSDREKQLYQRRLKEQRGKQTSNEKDW